MNECDAPREEGAARPRARFREVPEDFVVDELPAYEASGAGEHLMIHFRKRGLTTPDAIARIAGALGASPHEAGFAGMKDRHAVTTQRATFFLGSARADGEAELAARRDALAALSAEGIDVLGATRHGNKLKPGHLAGNRFTIVLRGLDREAAARGRAALEGLRGRGVPNAFGPQRFGRDGDNPERALAWLSGRARAPKDPKLQRLLFSAVQSLAFNDVLEARERAGTWRSILPGDVAKKTDTGGLFDVPLEGDELDDARARGESGLVVPTGPMFGVKMRWPRGEVLALEEACLRARLGEVDLGAFRHLGEGTRRSLVLPVEDLSVEEIADSRADTNRAPDRVFALRVSFALAKGGYATTVLERAFVLLE